MRSARRSAATGASANRIKRAPLVARGGFTRFGSSDARLSLVATALRLGVSIARVEWLLEQEAGRRALARLACDRVDNALLRERLRHRQLVDPSLTASELAHRLGTSPIQVQRWLGLRPTAPKTDRRGRVYPGRLLTQISVENAGRLARAMGYAPCEIDGC